MTPSRINLDAVQKANLRNKIPGWTDAYHRGLTARISHEVAPPLEVDGERYWEYEMEGGYLLKIFIVTERPLPPYISIAVSRIEVFLKGEQI